MKEGVVGVSGAVCFGQVVGDGEPAAGCCERSEVRCKWG